MKRFWFVVLLILGFLFIFAGEKKEKPQTQCPITGAKVDRNLYLDYQGQRIYFCCRNCIEEFEKDKEKYFEKFEKDGVILENIQEVDPVCGMKLKEKKIYSDYKGRRIYFCSENCVGKFKEEPQKYLEKLNSKTVK